ncbi:MAG TPA: hypothetical protein VGL86_11740, partial [Polyangia bacterium]
MPVTTRFASYRASGRVGPLTIALFAAATVGGAGVAWIYQMGMTWIPYIYINLVLCGLFGAGLGAAGAFAVRRGHCRNRVVALVLAVPLALTAVGASYYWAYESTIAKVAEHNPGASVADIRAEVTFARWVEARKAAGWTMSSHSSSSSSLRASTPDISGAGVFVIWAIEALAILGIAALVVDAEAKKPYCERCNRWCAPKPITLGGLTRLDVEHAVQLGDLMPLVDIQVRSDGDAARSIVLTGTVCDGCSDTAFLSVDEK